MTRPRDKRLERHYLEFCASELGVGWRIVEAGEAPDFLVAEGDRTFGLEVTRAFTDSARAGLGSEVRQREGIALKSMDRIRRTFEERTGATISVTFTQRPRVVDEAAIAELLVALGLHQQSLGSVAEITVNGVRAVARRTFNPVWRIVTDSAGWVDRQGHVQLQQCVTAKSPRARSYSGPGVSDLRLLVVADAYLNSGKLRVDPNAAVDPMGFTRVYFAAYPLEVLAFPT